MKKCPFCAELIQDDAIKCRYCGSMLSGSPPAPASGGIWQQQVRGLLSQDQKIEAITLVRQQTGCGLRDAKDFVEAMERGESPAVPPPAVKQTQTAGCAIVALLLVAAVLFLLYFRR